jgi:hypothetical protein
MYLSLNIYKIYIVPIQYKRYSFYTYKYSSILIHIYRLIVRKKEKGKRKKEEVNTLIPGSVSAQ